MLRNSRASAIPRTVGRSCSFDREDHTAVHFWPYGEIERRGHVEGVEVITNMCNQATTRAYYNPTNAGEQPSHLHEPPSESTRCLAWPHWWHFAHRGCCPVVAPLSETRLASLIICLVSSVHLSCSQSSLSFVFDPQPWLSMPRAQSLHARLRHGGLSAPRLPARRQPLARRVPAMFASIAASPPGDSAPPSADSASAVA